MKLTKEQLIHIIKEEIQAVMGEGRMQPEVAQQFRNLEHVIKRHGLYDSIKGLQAQASGVANGLSDPCTLQWYLKKVTIRHLHNDRGAEDVIKQWLKNYPVCER